MNNSYQQKQDFKFKKKKSNRDLMIISSDPDQGNQTCEGLNQIPTGISQIISPSGSS